jgi:hypothetical protein
MLYAAAAPMMDPAACNVVYVDQRAKDDKQVRRDSVALPVPSICDQQDDLSSYLERGTEDPEVLKNIQALLSVFNHGARNSLFFYSALIFTPSPHRPSVAVYSELSAQIFPVENALNYLMKAN